MPKEQGTEIITHTIPANLPKEKIEAYLKEHPIAALLASNIRTIWVKNPDGSKTGTLPADTKKLDQMGIKR